MMLCRHCRHALAYAISLILASWLTPILFLLQVDGDTSTNDTVIALASGLSGLSCISSLNSDEATQLQAGLDAVSLTTVHIKYCQSFLDQSDAMIILYSSCKSRTCWKLVYCVSCRV